MTPTRPLLHRRRRRGGAVRRVMVITLVVAVAIFGVAYWKLPMVRDGVTLLIQDLGRRLEG